MYFRPPFYKRKKFWQAILFIGMGVLFAVAFRNEIGDLLRFLKGLMYLALGRGVPDIQVWLNEAVDSFIKLTFNLLLGFFFLFLLWLVITAASAVLPVGGLLEAHRTAWHLLLYLFGMHGQAVFIKNGKVIADAEELRRNGPGIVVTYFDSAVVLEEGFKSGSFFTPLTNFIQNQILTDLDLADSEQSPRARGPGITFTRLREKIRGVVDLRRQFRTQEKASGYTRDGIEINTRVNVLFTVGEDPEVLHITYQGPPLAENLRVVEFEKPGENGPYRITRILDELDDQDKAEIHQLIVNHPPQPPVKVFFHEGNDRYRYTPDRVLNAVLSQPRDGNHLRLLPWQDLPLEFSVGIFSEMLSHQDYNQLYEFAGSGLRLRQFQREFMLRVRNNGVLSFQYIKHRLTNDLAPGQYDPRRIAAYPVMPLTGAKVLRERGIKVIFAGFGDLLPVSQAVYEQRLDSWRAPWQQSTAIIQAETELEATRVQNHARAAAQEELMFSISRLMKLSELSRQAVALRVLQAVETAAADPHTSQLLPGDTINLLRNIHAWLNDEETPPQRVI